MRVGSILASGLVLALSIVSTTFVFLTLKSTKWSTESYYFALNGISNGTDEVNPVCMAGRSPFYRCGLPVVDSNGHCSIPNCAFYAPYGANATSCRSSAELGVAKDDNLAALGLLGTEQECQQVHYAGNLQIAASVFITVGLACGLILCGLALGPLGSGGVGEEADTTRQQGEEEPQEDAVEADRALGRHKEKHRKSLVWRNSSHCHNGVHYSASRRTTATKFVVTLLLTCLCIGALLQFLAQFFGVLGLTINAYVPVSADQYTPDPDSSSPSRFLNNFIAHPWVIGQGMAAYATVVWTSAMANAVLVGVFFSRPVWPKIL
ncbi:hypothetical protein GQ53DRAFT_753585 [Thozetella sp. PMI_491]|nr:hypothetical protein GQ53DRAFT_753585 [Thozetella sp. PMI_491]